jgi:hypothetical protein
MNMDISELTPERQQELWDHYGRLSREQDGQRILQDASVAYLDPTFDRTFKWLMGPDNSDIARTVFDSMVFLTYRGLVTRGVQSIHSLSTETDKRSEQLSKLPGSGTELLMMDVPVELDLFADLYGFNQMIIEEISNILEDKKLKQDDIKRRLSKFEQSLEERYDVLLQTKREILPQNCLLDSLGNLSTQLEEFRNEDDNRNNQIYNVQTLFE